MGAHDEEGELSRRPGLIGNDGAENAREQEWEGRTTIDANRSGRGSEKPVETSAEKARWRDQGSDPQMSSGPAAIPAAHEGRTYGCNRPTCRSVEKSPCQGGVHIWSPSWRSSTRRFEVDHPGDYATLNSNQLRDSTAVVGILFSFGTVIMRL